MINTYTCQITEETIPQIIADAAKWNLKVTPQHDLEEAEEFGETCYAILSVNYEYRHATFTTSWGDPTSDDTWYYDGATHGRIWKRIQLKNRAR